MIIGTGSNCGKTTVTCALLSALKKAGKTITAFKCGPDYIDPMFHSKVLETKSRNLDPFLCGNEVMKFLLARDSKNADAAVIEGVMGMYDGLGFESDKYSANYISGLTETPQILVVNVKGKSLSLAAEISGYINFSENRIAGVILNNCSKGMYDIYKQMLNKQLGLRCYGYLPFMPEAEIGSRHLGLITADEIDSIRIYIKELGETASKTLDINGLLDLARSASPFEYNEIIVAPVTEKPVRVGIARDWAFCFYYEDVLELLEETGCELVPFSPVNDKTLPADLHGLILGGGYPELYAQKLSENVTMRDSIHLAVSKGMPTYAECGGFMYLGKSITVESSTYSMCGALDTSSHMTKGLVRFGYKILTAKKDNLICRAGDSIPCHEFHYSNSDNNGSDFILKSPRRTTNTEAIFGTKNIFAGYPHLHLWCKPEIAASFIHECAEYREKISDNCKEGM